MIAHNLTSENYYQDSSYMSVSSFKRFLKCEEEALQPFPPPTISMLVGSYVDSFVEGTLDTFIKEHPDIFVTKYVENENTIPQLSQYEGFITRNNTIKSNMLSVAKQEHPECFTITQSLKSEYQKAEEICEYITNDKVFSQFMSGEKQTIMVGEIFGVPWKIKMDSYSPHIAINDLKVMATVTNRDGKYYDFITPWGYDIQLAVYQEIVRQNTGDTLPVYICAVTKETPIDSVIVKIPDHILYQAMCVVEEHLPRVMGVKNGLIVPERCECCKHCKSTKTTTKIIRMEELF